MKLRAAQTYILAAMLFTSVGSLQGANKFTILHHFLNNPAAQPLGNLVADAAGNLYGTTRDSDVESCGSSFGCGTVFKLTRQPGGKWSYSVLHSFKGPDGEIPSGGLIIDSLGNLYGTTEAGGPHHSGTVFELSFSDDQWKHKILYDFGAPDDVASPEGTLLSDESGNLYGVAEAGPSGWGGVFELKYSNNGWQETVLHVFENHSDGAFPNGNMVRDSAGNLYGATLEGGDPGLGIVFRLTQASDGSWTETILHTFAGSGDGAYPMAGLTIDAAGNLYGTASGGPGSCGQFGCGTVFRLTPSMNKWTFNVLHTFHGSDGASPSGPLVFDTAGSLYATTAYGGRYSYGVVFKLSHNASHWTETVLHSFNLKGGAYPSGGLIFDQMGVIYGTTSGGGIDISACSLDDGCGVAFSITP